MQWCKRWQGVVTGSKVWVRQTVPGERTSGAWLLLLHFPGRSRRRTQARGEGRDLLGEAREEGACNDRREERGGRCWKKEAWRESGSREHARSRAGVHGARLRPPLAVLVVDDYVEGVKEAQLVNYALATSQPRTHRGASRPHSTHDHNYHHRSHGSPRRTV